MFKPPGQCPNCGEWVRRKALACDCCGACEKSGWKSDAAIYDGVDIPNDEFDYDSFVANEFGNKAAPSKRPWWWWVALGLLIIGVIGLIMRLPVF